MRYSALLVSLVASALASPINDIITRDGLKRICPGLNTQDSGCVRYTKGFDVTGVVTEVGGSPSPSLFILPHPGTDLARPHFSPDKFRLRLHPSVP